MFKQYKYRLHPTKEQEEFFEKSFGCVRFVYNWALNERIKAYQKDGKRISWVESCKRLTELKKQDIGQIKLYMNYVDKNIKYG